MTVPYDLVRALHIISVIGWMAGMLMLPRFYAYQTGAIPGGELDLKMRDASAKLRNIILTPALLLTWTFGLWLFFVYDRGMWSAPWLIGKITLVTLLTGFHGYLVAEGKRLAKGEMRRTEKFWRMVNEVPFLVAIVVVLLATLEPMFP